jgi:diguanylate cyclase (GGDEF)-like protein/PAS domain S-box-containing protein
LEASQAELQRAQTVSKVGSWVYDIAADTMRLSSQTAHIFGLSEGIVGNHDTYLERVHPDDRQALDLAWQSALAGEVFDHEHRIFVRGAVRWIRQKAEFTFGPDGKATSAVGVTQDVTERKHAQSALEESEERYRTLTEWSPDAILVHRMGRVLYVNSAAVRLFAAATAEDLLGKHTPALIHPDYRAQQFARMEQINNKAVIKPLVQSRFLRLDGSAIDVEVQGTAIVYDGEPAIHVSIRDITERKKSEERINELAFYDQLTGLPNRTFLLERLKQCMSASARSLNYAALLFIDLDDFKKLNDTLGHDMGDVLLKQVAQRLAACVRAEDTVGRLGGDEFVVLLENLGTIDADAAQQTEVAGEKIRVVLSQLYQLGDTPYHCTPSIGATVFMGQNSTVDNLLKQADLAMYKSKAAGRNALRFFNVEMERSVMARAALERDLRAAVRQQQFVLHYQPQITGDGVVTAAEVLVRWQHPQRGMVSPADFIPLAEETGLIVSLGAWVLETACAQLARWSQQPALAHLTISVNVSARQFHQSNFVPEVMSILDRTGARPDRLRLELTESLLVAQIDDVIEKMRLLKNCGVGFSLDDFGTGYSSLFYLSQLPLDELKIDRSFVMGIESRDDAVAICAATISLAHSLKLKVVAEGVETQAQRYFLQTVHRCDYLQGYLFSRPIPVHEFEEFVVRKGKRTH